MKQESPPSCCSVFLEGAAAASAEKYTQLWIQLINQIERSKQILAGIR